MSGFRLRRGRDLSCTGLFRVLGYVGLFFGTVLILRVVIAISRDGI